MATARLDLRIDEEVKAKAEKASALLGLKSLTEYVVRLMDENASKVISEHESITVNDDIFDQFHPHRFSFLHPELCHSFVCVTRQYNHWLYSGCCPDLRVFMGFVFDKHEKSLHSRGIAVLWLMTGGRFPGWPIFALNSLHVNNNSNYNNDNQPNKQTNKK